MKTLVHLTCLLSIIVSSCLLVLSYFVSLFFFFFFCLFVLFRVLFYLMLATRYFDDCGVESLDVSTTRSMLSTIDSGRTEVKLVAGDVGVTCSKFVEDNPGFKISFLNMDLDLEEPTFKVDRRKENNNNNNNNNNNEQQTLLFFQALEALWPRVSASTPSLTVLSLYRR